jgi:hypothetical protein
MMLNIESEPMTRPITKFRRAKKLSDDIREKVLKAVEGGMTCRQGAAHCGVSLASAIRFAKWAGVPEKRAKAKRNVRFFPLGDAPEVETIRRRTRKLSRTPKK